jgi:Uma2 family endonuclease
MSTTTTPNDAIPIAPLDPTLNDPYFYGWRTVIRWQPNGSPKWERVPLTEWDVLHPQEEDFIVHNDAHDQNSTYLRSALRQHFEGRSDVKVLHNHRVDWEVPGIIPHGPDIAVFEGLRKRWDPDRGTFKVKEMTASPMLVVEVTSPSTRKGDLNEKVVEYFKAGVPFYLIVDRSEAEDKPFVRLLAYRTTPEGFVQMTEDPEKGVWIPTVRLWFKVEGEWIACYAATGTKLLDTIDLAKHLQEEKDRAEQERQRAEQERQRAEQERQRAEDAIRQAERDRQEAEALRRKLKEAEDRLKDGG